MAKIKKLNLIFLIAVLIAVVSWYGISLTKKQAQKENEKYAEKDVTNEEVKTATSSDSEKIATSTSDSLDTKDWQTYRNEEYGFEFKYPNIYLSDCSKIQNELSISISDTEKEDCYSWPDGRIGVGFEIYNKNKPDFNYDSYIIKKVKLNNQEIDQVTGYYEIKGSEGEILPYHPKSKVILSLIPYKKDKYILLSYSQLYSLKKGIPSNGFKIEKNIEDIYYLIVKSFKFF